MGARDKLLESTDYDAERARLSFGAHEVSYHCDKFNTRVIKGLEDVIGYEDAHSILEKTAGESTIKLIGDFFENTDASDEFAELESPDDKLNYIFEVFKAGGYGAFEISSADENGGEITSPSSYIAEGWLENMERWKWPRRENPVCHDSCGYISAAFSIAFDKDELSYKTAETTCRSCGDDICTFKVEVK